MFKCIQYSEKPIRQCFPPNGPPMVHEPVIGDPQQFLIKKKKKKEGDQRQKKIVNFYLLKFDSFL